MNSRLQDVLTSIAVGTVIFLTTIFLSEAIFGDLTKQDSYKPLFVVVPVFAAVGFYLVRSQKVK